MFQKNISGIETLIHVHDSDSGYAIARCDCRLNRSGAAPSGKQRCVKIQTGDSRRVQNRSGKNLSVGHHDDYVRRPGANFRNRFVTLNAPRLQDRDSGVLDQQLDWRWFEALIPAGRFVWLSDHTDEFVFARLLEHPQRRHANVARADKNDAHPR